MNKGYYESPIGLLKIKAEEGYITEISFASKRNEENPSDEIRECIKELKEYFDGKRKSFDVKIKYAIGTDFQKKVWDALRKIEYGKTASYKDIAKLIGNEKASRAVGSANNKNPILIIVPCHRIIGANGKLVGYAGGLDKKEKLLNHEKVYFKEI